jgi:phosphoribosylformylglycinamidine cyclo-ligase
MYTTFNCGVGLVLVIDRENSRTAIETLAALGETVWELGTISKREKPEVPVIFY